jgi:hypothetical protein
MLVVYRDSCPGMGERFLPLQPVERPAESTLESCEKSEGQESSQMLTDAGLQAVFHGTVQ